MIIVGAAMVVLGLLLAVFVLLPLRKIGHNAEQIARGNFTLQIYDGKLTKGMFKSSDEKWTLTLTNRSK
jgi:hypothetical protein